MQTRASERNDRARTLKSVLVGLVVGSLFCGAMYWRGSPKDMAAPFEKWSEPVVDAIKAGASALGLAELAEFCLRFVFGPGLPFAAGVFVAGATFMALRWKMVKGWPAIDQFLPCCPDILDPELERTGISRFRPLAAGTAFTARDEDMRALRRFANTAEAPGARFMFITGKEGVGKTRLALEWLKTLKKQGWDVGRLDPQADVFEIRRTRFRRKTAILIDEPGALPEFWPRLAALLKASKPIRIVLANQIMLHRPDSLDDETRALIDAGQAETVRLDGLPLAALRTLAPDRPEKELDEAAGCPLWVLLRPEDRDELERRAGLRETSAQSAQLSRTLALAALAAPLPRAALREVLNIYVSTPGLEAMFEDSDPASLAVTLPPLLPHVFADHILLRDLGRYPEEDNRAFLREALDRNPAALAHRLASLWRRKTLNEEQKRLRAWLQESYDALAPGAVAAIHARAEALFPVGRGAIPAKVERQEDNPHEPEDLARLQARLVEMADLVDCRPFDRVLRLAEAYAAIEAILCFRNVGDKVALQPWVERLFALSDNPEFAEDSQLLWWVAGGLANLMSVPGHLRSIGVLKQAEQRYLAIVDQIQTTDRDKADMLFTSGAVNATIGFGEIQEIPSVERWAFRLVPILENPDHRNWTELHHYGSMAMINAIRASELAKQLQNIEVWIQHLPGIVSGFSAVQDIPLLGLTARGLNAAMYAYGLAGDFENMERRGKDLAALARLPQTASDREIALWEANASMRSAFLYGKAGRIDDADRWARHLVQQVDGSNFQDELAFQTKIAQAAANAISDFRNAGRRADARFWANRLDLCLRFEGANDHEALRLAEARGAVNAVVAFDQREDFDDLQYWAARMMAIAEDARYRTKEDFRIEEAKCALNIISVLQDAGEDLAPFRQLWRKRLAKAAREFPGSAEIQAHANMLDLTYAAQAAKGWPYGPPLH